MTTLAPDLLRDQAYVDGAWIDADSGATFPVVDPATGVTIAEVPRLGAAETRRAIEAAQRALPAWKHRTAKDRARILRRLADLMMERSDDLAALLVREQGKPLFEAKAEIGYAASFYEWFAEEAKRLDGRVIPQSLPDRRIVVLREAIGVTAGITPWNFPAAMPTRKSAPALAVGCTMVLKPAEQTPLTALAIAALAEEAGVPAGVFSVVTGDAADAPAIGGEMTSNPIVRKLGFTGSTEVGKLLMAQCAGQVKKVSLELGGNAPFIVFDDADLEAAVAGRDDVQVPELGADLHLGQPVSRPGRDLRGVRRRVHRGRRSAQGRGRVHRGRAGRAPDRRAGRCEGRAPRRRRARAGRRSPRRRQSPRGPVLRAVRPHGRDDGHGDELRGDLRPGRGHQPVRDRRRGGRDRERHAVRARPPTSTRATSSAPGVSRRGSSTGSSASTPASSPRRWRRSAA